MHKYVTTKSIKVKRKVSLFLPNMLTYIVDLHEDILAVDLHEDIVAIDLHEDIVRDDLLENIVNVD